MDYVDFGNFLNERMRERGFSLKRLAEASGIPLKHLENLSRANPEALPPTPYIRGYILKLARILDFDGQSWWTSLQKEEFIKSSGQKDRLPENRFAKKPLKKYILLFTIIGALLIYFAFSFYKIFGRPVIIISAPAQNPAVVQQNYAALIGKLTNGSELLVNGEQIDFDRNGYFQKTLNLQPGINTIEINAGKFLGGETKIIRQIIYQPPASSTTNF